MSSINSSAFYSVGNQTSSSNGVSGLMSGMDTETMVKDMLAGTQAKIDKQLGVKQQTEWKQEKYRDVISSINTFHSTYFDSSYGASHVNNFASNDFFNSMLSSVNDDSAVQILSTNSNATPGELHMAVTQLASTSHLSSEKTLSGEQKIIGETLDSDSLTKLFNKSVVLQLSDFGDVSVNLNHVQTEEELTQAFQSAFASAGVLGVEAEIYDGSLRFVSEDANRIITIDDSSTELGLQMAGLQSTTKSNVNNLDGSISTMLEGGTLNLQAGISFDLSFDGIQKTITLNNVQGSLVDGQMVIDANNIQEALQKEVDDAFGNAIAVSLTPDNSLQLQVNIFDNEGALERGHELIISGQSASDIGLSPGSSTLVSTSSKLGDLGLQGDLFSFSINGEEFSFDSDVSLGQMMNTINQSDAGVRITYSSFSDTVKLEATSSGSRYGITLEQQTGDLLGVLFGSDAIAPASSVVSSKLTTNVLTSQSAGLDADYTTESTALSFRVNGEQHTFSLPVKEGEEYSKEIIEQEFNDWLEEKFGSSEIEGVTTANIRYEDGALKIQKGFAVSFDQTAIDQRDSLAVEEAMKSDLAYAMGFNRQASSNTPEGSLLISDVYELQGIDPASIKKSDGSQATTLDEIASIGGNDITFVDGSLKLTASSDVDLSTIPQLSSLFGGSVIKLGEGKVAENAIHQGTDAKIVVNGVETSRSSNTFTVNGISMEVNELSDDVIINTKRDVDSIVDGFKAFVEDYNKMIESLNSMTSEEAEYKDYPPLTDAQRDEMSDKEIELWEEKSKTGLLHNDEAINSFLSEMRLTLYEKPVNSEIALYSIGIETTADYNDGGKIQLNEALLREALASDADSVKDLFTNSVDGIAEKMSAVMENSANKSFANPGWLVQLAGIDGHSTEKNNTLYDEINNLEARISTLRLRYETEKTRYWDQFNAMESIMSTYNAQSLMLAEQYA